MENKKIIAWVIIGLFVLGGLGMMSFSNGKTNHANTNEQKLNLFEGKITNIQTTPGTVNGVGVYDKTCKDIGNGLTKCDAGIKTKEYGVLNFNYIHDMTTKPCITSGDKLKVEILDSKGTAKVQRFK